MTVLGVRDSSKAGVAGLFLTLALVLGICSVVRADDLPVDGTEFEPPVSDLALPKPPGEPEDVEPESAQRQKSFDFESAPAPTIPEVGKVGPAIPQAAPESVTAPAPQPRSAPGDVSRGRHEHWLKQQQVWPGRYVGLRAAGAVGNAVVPKFGLGAAERANRRSIPLLAPYLGVEAGYVQGRWGASATFDGTFLISTPSDLATRASHFMLGINGLYVPNQRTRWSLGLIAWGQYRMEWQSGQVMMLNGYGLRGGGHLRMSEAGPIVLESFILFGFENFTEVEIGFRGNTKSYPVTDLVGADRQSTQVSVTVGFQLNFVW